MIIKPKLTMLPMARVKSISAFTNKVTTLEQVFNEHAVGASRICIGSAFIDEHVVALVKKWLQVVPKKRPRIEFLTGFYQGFTRRKCLEELQRVTKRFSGWMQTRISAESSFHWKFYAFANRRKMTLFNGSANFTHNGLHSGGEMMWIVQLPVDKPASHDLLQVFEEAFRMATPIETIDLAEYPERQLSRPPKGFNKIINKLLQRKTTATAVEPEKFCRITKIQEAMGNKTIAQVREHQSNWDKRNWWFYSTSILRDYEEAARSKYIVNFYWEKGNYYVDLYMRKDQAKLPDIPGKYFIAYTRPRKERKIQGKVKQQLDEVKLPYRTRPGRFTERFANKRQCETIKAIFNIKD